MTTLLTSRFPADSAAVDNARWQKVGVVLIGLGCLARFCWPIIIQRWDTWRDETAIRATLNEFFHAVADGRQDAALQLLGDAVDVSAIAAEARQETDWRPSGSIDIRYSEIVIENGEAQAHLTIVQDGGEILPTVSLNRAPGGRWRIRRIDEVSIAPRWTWLQECQPSN